jgi:hypothetical protein
MMTYHNYTPRICITHEKLCILRMQGSLTPYLKLGGCAASLLTGGVQALQNLALEYA